jgi:hypothetical protein
VAHSVNWHTVMYAYHDENTNRIVARYLGFESTGAPIQVTSINDIVATSLFPYVDFTCKDGAVSNVLNLTQGNDMNAISCVYIQHDNQIG